MTNERSWATWRIRLAQAVYLTVSVGGNAESDETTTAKELQATGELLAEIGAALSKPQAAYGEKKAAK